MFNYSGCIYFPGLGWATFLSGILYSIIVAIKWSRCFANAFAEDVQLAKNTGMNGHIAKQLDMNKLNDVLENWL